MTDATPPPDQGSQPQAGPGSSTGAGEAPDAADGQRNLDDLNLSAVAAQPGATGERMDAEREARLGLSNFARAAVQAEQVYGGGHYEFYGQSTRPHFRTAQMSATEVTEAADAFVTWNGLSNIIRESSGKPIVFVRGAQGSGKYALARYLLVQSDTSRQLFRVDPATDWSLIEDKDLEKGAGYVVEDVTAAGIQTMSAFQFQRVGQDLAGRGATLFIPVPAGTATADPVVAGGIIDFQRTVDPEQVAHRYLAWRSGSAGRARATRLLQRPEIAGLITELCGSGTRFARAAEIGCMLADATAPEKDVAAEVAGRVALMEVGAFEDWFEGLDDLDTQCLAIAVAVFGGEPYDTVAALAAQLQQRIQLPESPDNPDHRRSAPVMATRRRRLERLHATLQPSQVATRHGGAPPGLVVRYKDAGIPARVVNYAWDELDGIRAELMAWLRHCAVHELATVRVRAAVAVGVLATRSFDMLRADVLYSWASQRNQWLHDAAAIALDTAAEEDPGLLAAVRNLVTAWASEGERPSLRASSARAWRTLLDEDGTAARHLHFLAATDDVGIIEAICASAAEYLTFDDESRRREAITLLLHLARSRQADRQLVGELAFLYAAADLITRLPDTGVPGGQQDWPGLLVIATRDPMRQREIAELWRVAASSPEAHEPAHAILAEWAHMVEPSGAARRALARLLAAAATTPRSMRIFRYQAESWAADHGGIRAPVISGEVLAYLQGRNESR